MTDKDKNLFPEENNKKTEPTENNKLIPDKTTDQPIVKEMSDSYLDYAMSVIVSRALPDVRDGLKPVHRRILYSMNEIGLHYSAKYRKSAAVVGDVLAKYHPHGDTAVYDSMVRMAQEFSLRYPLVLGQGNFGSIDGDNAAAMRYTEAKMQKFTEEILADIDKETVAWADNYDGTKQEPKVLPAKIPQLLLNGSMGIAVGMATNIPPHNLGEIIDGVVHLIHNPDATIDDLMEFIKGPDFPTSGIIYDVEAIKAMYVNGRGGIQVRGKTEIVEKNNGKFRIIITEIPYQVNKANLVSKIAELVRDKKIIGITDLRDESNREGIRVVVELKKDAFPKKVLNQIFKLTTLQTSFNMNMIALVDGIQPRLLNLKSVLEYFLKHRKEVLTNRTKYELKIAKARAHILEGLKIALDNIDEIISTIRKAETKEIAHEALMKKFKLSSEQCKAILEMRLQALAGLERKKVENELREKLALIGELESILADPERILTMIKEELAGIKEKYADARRTQVVPNAIGKFSSLDTIPDESMIITLTKENYIKRMPPASFKSQHRGGKGVIGATTKDEDEIKIVKNAKTHDEVMFFTNKGRVFCLPVYEIPQAGRTAKGQAIVNLLQLGEKEYVSAIFTRRKNETLGKYLIMATKKGTVKKTEITQFKNVRRSGLIAIKLRENDSLEWVKVTNEGDEVMLVTRNGKCIRFDEKNVRSMGRASTGVRGIRLKEGDKVVEMDVIKKDQKESTQLTVISENGLGKKTLTNIYRFQTRGGSGVKTANLTTKTGKIIGAKIFAKETKGDILLISKQGQTIRLNIKSIPNRGRATQGVYLMRLKKADKIASISFIIEEEPKETQETTENPQNNMNFEETEKKKSKEENSEKIDLKKEEEIIKENEEK